MKLRLGFVSNSSSSSFVVATKKKLTEKTLKEYFGAPKGSVAEQLVEPYIDIIMGAEPFDLKEMLDDYGYKTLEDMKEEYGDDTPLAIQLKEEGWDVRTFRVHSDDYDDHISVALHNGGWPGGDVNTKDLKIIHEY